MVEERYVIGRMFYTNNWFVYDNKIDKYIYSCNNPEKAEKYINRRCEVLEKLVGRRYTNLELLKNDIELLTKRNIKSIIESESDRFENSNFMIDFCFKDNEHDIGTVYCLKDNAGQYYITEV